MPRFVARTAPAVLTGLLLAGCGSSASTADSPAVVPPSGAASPSPAGAGASSGGASPASRTGESGSAAVTTSPGPEGATPAQSAAPAGSQPSSSAADRVPLPPPGTYTYRLRGSSASALGKQSLDGDSTLTVDQPQGNREHSTQRDRGGSTEQVLVARTGGLYLAEVHLAQPGFDEDFKPNAPALLFPASAHAGQRWHWQMTSTDGKYTLTAHLQVQDLHSSATMTDGTRVDTVSLASVLHLHSNNIDLTIHQNDEAGRDAVIVREHATTDGTAYGTPFHSDATRVLARRPG